MHWNFLHNLAFLEYQNSPLTADDQFHNMHTTSRYPGARCTAEENGTPERASNSHEVLLVLQLVAPE